MPPKTQASFEYSFPALRGRQSGRDYFVSMCPLELVPKLFHFDDDELPPELRAQRTLNERRVPEIARYVHENPRSYVFSALTASIDGTTRFEPVDADDLEGNLGTLHVSMASRFIINDGQHRRAAIELALHERPELASESIAIVFFVDPGLERCQQMFADLNRYVVRPSQSLGVLYDHRDEDADISRVVAMKSHAFRGVVEMEKSTLSRRSRKLFTLSAIHGATQALLHDVATGDQQQRTGIALTFWDAIAEHMPEWRLVRDHELSAGEVRTDYIHTHGIVLQALGRTGNAMRIGDAGWDAPLARLEDIDWTRANTELWEGRAMIGGRVSKSRRSILLTTSVIKRTLGIELTEDEAREEQRLEEGGSA